MMRTNLPQNTPVARAVAARRADADRPVVTWGTMFYRFLVALAVMGATALAAHSQEPGPVILPDQNAPQAQTPMFPAPGQGEFMPQPYWAVSDADFNALLTAINNQTFASNQLPMVQAAGLCGWFTCVQCAALMNCFDFDSNRMQVVRYLAPHIIDPIQCQPIMDQLAYITDRQTAWKILSAARP